ncbi:ROK family protein [Gimibacter soli]|uniref:ROK family protein n=1 Tax=Gimibacter soli TaxID=3024400 RepID=A0AAE9XV76_9PROT|nr:ROK family protein [Gimibacter soli]WCL53439.1 ROK family protein [Gimibacter soli]
MSGSDQKQVLGGIDAGGTTFKCVLAGLDGEIIARKRIPVSVPEATIASVTAFFREALSMHNATMKSLGVASFGPIDIDPASDSYGTILETPKPGWASCDLCGRLSAALGVPVHVETDVNGALLAEMAWGAAKGCASAAYVTVGTGIGAGIYTGGRLLGHPVHPEFGHIRLQRHPKDLGFKGSCVFHGDCLEGLASAKALQDRFGDPAALPADHLAWEIEAYYLAQASLSLVLMSRVERVILGGGILLADGLIEKVRVAYDMLMNGYVKDRATIELISTPGLGDDAGLKGGILLAMRGAGD